MTRDEARGVIKNMVTEYATSMAWLPDDIDEYRDEAWEALNAWGVSSELVIYGEPDDD